MATTSAANRGRFIWQELLTTDVALAEGFYKEVVGWGSQDMGMPDGKYTMFTAGETPIAGVTTLPQQAVDMGAPPHWIAYCEVPDCDETVEQALSLGAKLLVPAQTVPDVGRFAMMADPQGATFAFITGAREHQPEGDPQPKEFSWHELATTDLDGAIKFYQAIFGWVKQSEFDMGPMGTYHLYGRDRFTYGGMMKRQHEQQPVAWLHYARMTDTADAGAQRAQEAGAKVIVPPMDVPGGDRVAVLIDPQGAAFAVHSK